MNSIWRNTTLLALSQGLMVSTISLIMTCSALVGQALATDKSLSTLPVAVMFITTMLISMPASFFMAKIGHKFGFMLASIIGFLGGGLSTYAIIQQNFWLFVAGIGLIGLFNGFGNYFRFVAADSVEVSQKSKAISFVMVGGLAAAFIGPNLAHIAKNWISNAEFAGSYALTMLIYLLIFTTLGFLKLPKAEAEQKDKASAARPLREIVKQPLFIVAVLCAMLGYGVMSLVMTATPLAMHHHAHAFSDTSFVIEWHFLGMFAPSFFTGYLIREWGLKTILWLGVLMGFACVGINLIGHTIWHFWLALVLLGISWNFLFIGGTSLLTETYHPNERAKTQAINDFLVFSTVALSSLSAGYLQHQFGWRMVNVGVLPILGLIMLSLFWLSFQKSNAVTTAS